MVARTKKSKRNIKSYAHAGKNRANNPPVGLVTPDTDPDADASVYSHDPNIDPCLSWAGKSEQTSFVVPTVSLHVHERIDPCTIINTVRKRNGALQQMSLFDSPEENPPIRQAIEFYKHQHNWTNRLIAGDSLFVMNSLLEKEGLGGQVQTVYIDPPYGIRYGSNFQPFVNKRSVKDGKDYDLTAEPEQIRAFRDTWETGVHSYLAYLRDRLQLARELLNERGSCFVQIGDENVHFAYQIMSEIFGPSNFMSLISFRTKIPLNSAHLPNIADYLIWFAREKSKIKFRRLFVPRSYGDGTQFSNALLPDGSVVKASDIPQEEREKARYFRLIDLMATGYTESCHYSFELDGRTASPNPTTSWKTTPEGMDKLIAAGRVRWLKTVPGYVFFADDYPVMEITNQWIDTQGATGKIYAVQTSTKVVERCILMTSDPGDLVFDPTCGSGTSAFVAEQWGRRWITCDTSRVALTLAKQRMMTANYKYFELARVDEGVGAGFACKSVPHITLGAIANNPNIRRGMSRDAVEATISRNAPQEILHDQPKVDNSKARVTGPFTVEAVPAPTVKSIDDAIGDEPTVADSSVTRTGETLRQEEWRDELFKTGIRGKVGQHFRFSRLEPLPGARWLHADGETRPFTSGSDNKIAVRDSERVVVSFGPDHAPIEQRQIAHAIDESQTLVPRPKVIIFAAFQFDPEASKDIDETRWPGVTLLKAQMNADLLTEDLKKKRVSNESFWLIGQPDIVVEQLTHGVDKGKFQVSVQGFDYYNTLTGNLESGGSERIVIWMLDTDYDGRSLFARQVFFPMAGPKDGWAKLARDLKAEIDEDLIEAYRGTRSLPFEPGEHNRVAVKIVDDRGIESLKIMVLDV